MDRWILTIFRWGESTGHAGQRSHGPGPQVGPLPPGANRAQTRWWGVFLVREGRSVGQGAPPGSGLPSCRTGRVKPGGGQGQRGPRRL